MCCAHGAIVAKGPRIQPRLEWLIKDYHQEILVAQ